MTDTNRGDIVAANAFLRRYLEDKAAGRVQPLASYLELFPADPIGLAEAYAILEMEGLRDASVAESDAGDLPAMIGPYRVGRELGRGGQAGVYLAEDTRFSRKVALKVVTDAGPASSSLMARFRREAEVIAKLDHPGICVVHDAGVQGRNAYIAMRYVEGETLARRIERAREARASHVQIVSPATPGSDKDATSSETSREGLMRVVRFVEAAARAVHAAHEAGIVHRDLKPGNIMVTPAGDPVVLDFGVARDEASDLPTLTATGDVFGTPAFLSPEQLRPERGRPDRRTDVWSLGATLYECVTLKRPFESATREGLFHAILTENPADPRRLNPAIPSDLAVVLETALTKELGRRYQSALDFAEDLRRVRSYEPIRARRAGARVRLQRWAQRNPTVAVLCAVILIGLTGGLVSTMMKNRELKRSYAEVLRLSDVRRLSDLEAWSNRLWPAAPELVVGDSGMDAWLKDVELLYDRLPLHEETLARLRATADSRAETSKEDPDDAWRRDVLVGLTDGLRKLPTAIDEMKRRRAFALAVDQRTIDDHRKSWDDVIAAISDRQANPEYGGLAIKPQRGLIPLGQDPRSRLFEFSHLQTGVAPARDPATGASKVVAETGLVFVLIPGGSFQMGAEPPTEADPVGTPNTDPVADESEAPVTSVTLDPFFLSKYEMTASQWCRITGDSLAQHVPFDKPFDDPWPRAAVVDVTWFACQDVLRRLALAFPTEAQWEYAARAKTTTIWWTGDEKESVKGAGNVADRSCRTRMGASLPQYDLWLDDGFVSVAPVGVLRPNPFGLHDVIGNAGEWCEDRFVRYVVRPRPGDGLRVSDDDHLPRVFRGGHWLRTAAEASSAHRFSTPPQNRSQAIGLRPARKIDA